MDMGFKAFKISVLFTIRPVWKCGQCGGAWLYISAAALFILGRWRPSAGFIPFSRCVVNVHHLKMTILVHHILLINSSQFCQSKKSYQPIHEHTRTLLHSMQQISCNNYDIKIQNNCILTHSNLPLHTFLHHLSASIHCHNCKIN